MEIPRTSNEEASANISNIATEDVFIGRQPICNTDLSVYAYELLFSGGKSDHDIQDAAGYQITSQVILNIFAEFGLEKLVGNRSVALNITESFLRYIDALPVTSQKLILSLPASMEINETYLTLLKQYSKRGIRLALDKFAYEDRIKPLLKLFDIVEINVRSVSDELLCKQINKLRKFKVRLLAKNVDSMEDYERLKQYDFKYFQGYFLNQPSVFKGTALSSNRLSVMRLIAKLNDPTSEAKDIANLVSEDITLSYKLLKIINSAAMGLPKQIDSIHQATLVMGRDNLASWASLIALSSINTGPVEILRIALTRAKACEHLARKTKFSEEAESFFTVGMFSALDILMQCPLEELIAPLPLNSEVTNAILRHGGDRGAALKCVLAYEEAKFEHAVFEGLENKEIIDANLRANEWVDDVIKELQTGK
ncbi:MAG: HDOD domain-containing protein [Gammaproteobacteria bacterium]|nr:HDOD domain-containing protein [Gammaproteobacteria bacterium]